MRIQIVTWAVLNAEGREEIDTGVEVLPRARQRQTRGGLNDSVQLYISVCLVSLPRSFFQWQAITRILPGVGYTRLQLRWSLLAGSNTVGHTMTLDQRQLRSLSCAPFLFGVMM